MKWDPMSKSILITGASSGIGKALTFELAQRGYALALTARRQALLEEIREEIKKRHPAALVEIRPLDVTAYDTIPSTIREMAEALNGLDIVFANAGIGYAGGVGQRSFERPRKVIETNLIGAMATVDAAVSYFLERGKGHIVATSSMAAFRGSPKQSAYCASKAGLAVYMEALRAEVYGKNIHVTVLYPGFIDTPINDMLPGRPFLISTQKGAEIIADRIEKRVQSAIVPRFPWCLLRKLLPILPTRIMARM
jgi:short-subunit dehydrogenase